LISLNNSSAASAILMSMKMSIDLDRLLRRSLVVIAVGGLAIGAAARIAGYGSLANQCWFAATVPVAAGLVYSIVRDIAAGRMGVDAIALVSMLGALGLGQPLAGVVIALMYSGGNVLEDFAVGRAERDLRALVDRAPRVAIGGSIIGSKMCRLRRSPSATRFLCAPERSSPSTASSFRRLRSSTSRHSPVSLCQPPRCAALRLSAARSMRARRSN
jgi:lysylphosphatidylglycerol synthetase-like protein (DUF2156 family)